MANATLVLSVACYTFLFAAKDFPQEPRQVVYEIRPLPVHEIRPSAMSRGTPAATSARSGRAHRRPAMSPYRTAVTVATRRCSRCGTWTAVLAALRRSVRCMLLCPCMHAPPCVSHACIRNHRTSCHACDAHAPLPEPCSQPHSTTALRRASAMAAVARRRWRWRWRRRAGCGPRVSCRPHATASTHVMHGVPR